jgi:hypothetical protein
LRLDRTVSAVVVLQDTDTFETRLRKAAPDHHRLIAAEL